ncbi:hypothetical protein SK128_022675, partial [Halocaridina rubra]
YEVPNALLRLHHQFVELQNPVFNDTNQTSKSSTPDSDVNGDAKSPSTSNGDSDSIPNKPVKETTTLTNKPERIVLNDVESHGHTDQNSEGNAGVVDDANPSGVLSASHMTRDSDVVGMVGDLRTWKSITSRSVVDRFLGDDLILTTTVDTHDHSGHGNLDANSGLDAMMGDMPIGDEGLRTITNSKMESSKAVVTDNPKVSIDEKTVEERTGPLNEVILSDTVMDMMKESDGDSEYPEGKETEGFTLPHPRLVEPATILTGYVANGASLDSTSSPQQLPGSSLMVTGLRVEDHSKGLFYDDFSGSILVDTDANVRFFGEGFTQSTEFLFTSFEAKFGDPCVAHTTRSFK